MGTMAAVTSSRPLERPSMLDPRPTATKSADAAMPEVPSAVTATSPSGRGPIRGPPTIMNNRSGTASAEAIRMPLRIRRCWRVGDDSEAAAARIRCFRSGADMRLSLAAVDQVAERRTKRRIGAMGAQLDGGGGGAEDLGRLADRQTLVLDELEGRPVTRGQALDFGLQGADQPRGIDELVGTV